LLGEPFAGDGEGISRALAMMAHSRWAIDRHDTVS
jgi:hypothetical protein